MVAALAGTEPWRPRILFEPGPRAFRARCSSSAGWARVALVQSRASLIAADDVSLDVEVGEGAALELVELGAMVVHHARGRRPAQLTASVSVAAGGRLIWLGQPLIVGAGALASASLAVALGRGAVALRGDAVVLGRAGEACGGLSTRTRIELDGAPLIDETLDTGSTALGSPVVAGGATMIAAVTLAGMRDETPPAGAMQAHRSATLWREAGGSVETGAAAAAVAGRWRGLLDDAPACASPAAGGSEGYPLLSPGAAPPFGAAGGSRPESGSS